MIHKIVNGEKVQLMREEIAAIEADEIENLKEEQAHRQKVGRSIAFGSSMEHIDRISKTLAHFKKNGIDLGEDGDEQCTFMEVLNQQYPKEQSEVKNETI